MAERNSEDIQCIARARHPIEAHIWRQALETEGIQCRVVGDYLSAGESGVPYHSPELWVHEADAGLARAILDVYRQAAAFDEEAGDEEE